MNKIARLIVFILSSYFVVGCVEDADSTHKYYENYDLFGKYSITSVIYYGIEIDFQDYFWGNLTDEQNLFLSTEIGPITLEDGHVADGQCVSRALGWPTRFYILSDNNLHLLSCNPNRIPVPYYYDRTRNILYVGWDNDTVVDVDDPQMKMEKDGDVLIFKEYNEYFDDNGERVCYKEPYRITKYSKSKTFPLDKYVH